MRQVRGASIEAAVATLELVGSERPELLEVVLDAVLNSPMQFAVYQLASRFDVPPGKLKATLLQACHHLDRLMRRRGDWRDPRRILQSPNLAALRLVCVGRLQRVSLPADRRRLEVILRRIDRAIERATSRARIEAFIGPTRSAKAPPTPVDQES